MRDVACALTCSAPQATSSRRATNLGALNAESGYSMSQARSASQWTSTRSAASPRIINQRGRWY